MSLAAPASSVSLSSLSGTVRVGWVDGTLSQLWIELDGEDAHSVVCFDDRESSPTRHRLFQGARRPDHPAARLVELGSEEEGIAIPAISRFVDSDEARRRLTERALEVLTALLGSYGSPMTGEDP